MEEQFGKIEKKKYFKILMEKILKPTKLNYGINVKEMWNGSIIKIPIKNENNKNQSNEPKGGILHSKWRVKFIYKCGAVYWE